MRRTIRQIARNLARLFTDSAATRRRAVSHMHAVALQRRDQAREQHGRVRDAQASVTKALHDKLRDEVRAAGRVA